MHNDLGELRRQFLDELRNVLELQLRLLHSTEADHAFVGREHASFGKFLDDLASHPQRPHIQRFSDMNETEFLRVEREYLSNFIAELNAQRERLSEVLMAEQQPSMQRFSPQELVEKMAELQHAGTTNQFNEAQRAAVLRVLHAKDYYGDTVSARFFPQEATHTGRTSRSEDSESEDQSLWRIKADVVAERLDGYKRVHERALCLAVLKVKAHMQSAATEPAHRPDFSVERLRERNLKGPNLEVFLSQPKNLLFTYYAQNLTKVVFFWGLSNEVVRRIVPNDPVPGLDTPSVTAVYFSREDAVVGCSFAATKDSSQDPVDALATLIDRFDFTTEYLRLSSLGSRPQSRPQPGDNETDEILRQFTEAL